MKNKYDLQLYYIRKDTKGKRQQATRTRSKAKAVWLQQALCHRDWLKYRQRLFPFTHNWLQRQCLIKIGQLKGCYIF